MIGSEPTAAPGLKDPIHHLERVGAGSDSRPLLPHSSGRRHMKEKKPVSKSGTTVKVLIFDECDTCKQKQKGCHSYCKAQLALLKGNGGGRP